MNYPHFLEDRLKAILYLYDNSAPTFEEIKRKIEAAEPPYNAARHPDDDSSEPLFFAEWEKADTALDLLGMSCLGHIQTALHTFLRDFTEGMWGKEALTAASKMNQKSWFGNYRALYATDQTLDWSLSGANLDFMEDMILTRNASQHGGELYSTGTFQDERHRAKYPSSSFGDPKWAGHGPVFRTRLIVTQEHLNQAVDAVRTLSKFLDSASLARQREIWREGKANSG